MIPALFFYNFSLVTTYFLGIIMQNAIALFGRASKRSVDEVLNAFSKAINDLTEVESNNMTEATSQAEKAEEARKLEEQALQEANRARAVREKLEAIIN